MKRQRLDSNDYYGSVNFFRILLFYTVQEWCNNHDVSCQGYQTRHRWFGRFVVVVVVVVAAVCVIADEGLTTAVVELIELVGKIVICGTKEETAVWKPVALGVS